jgi:hypothetical protein
MAAIVAARLLYHQPVPRVGSRREALHCRNEKQIVSHSGSNQSVGPDRQHWYSQLTLVREGLVVNRDIIASTPHQLAIGWYARRPSAAFRTCDCVTQSSQS